MTDLDGRVIVTPNHVYMSLAQTAQRGLPSASVTSTVLDQIDNVLDNLCGCGCKTPLGSDSASAYFADADCQRRWNEQQATNPRAVQGSRWVDPDEARWRPELLTADDDDGLRLLDPAPASYAGSLFATVFECTGGPGWHLRLHDGNRYVGLDVDPEPEGLDERLTDVWARLERELTDPRRLADGDVVWTRLRGCVDLGPAVVDEWSLTPGPRLTGLPGLMVQWRLAQQRRESRVDTFRASTRALGLTDEQWDAQVAMVVAFAQRVPGRIDIHQVAHDLLVEFGEPIDPVVALGRRFRGSMVPQITHDAPSSPPTDPQERALWHVRNRNTGPTPRQRAPRRINPRSNR